MKYEIKILFLIFIFHDGFLELGDCWEIKQIILNGL